MTPRKPKGLIEPPRWTEAELERERRAAIDNFRHIRMIEPLEQYLQIFEERQRAFETLLEKTVDLKELANHAFEVLTDPSLLDALRYLAGPPISVDDLKVLADARNISAAALKADQTLARRLVDMVIEGLDRNRFPWVSEEREPTEEERKAAILASTAVLASHRIPPDRTSESKSQQEEDVQTALEQTGFRKVAARTVATATDAPRPGEFCRESVLSGRKADILIGLGDNRLMPLECKVSNSATNSIKRLNKDAAVKAVVWTKELGSAHVVPAAVLSGVYTLRNLKDAQARGLTLFWAHQLSELTRWIAMTRV